MDQNNLSSRVETSVEWRNQKNIEMLTKTDAGPSFPFSVYGVDKAERPIAYVSAQDWNGMNMQVNPNFAHWLDIIEKSIKIAAKDSSETTLNQIVLVIDMDGIKSRFMRPTCLKFLAHIMNLYENRYPGLVFATYFINVPGYFKYFKYWVKLMHPFVSKNTLKRFKVSNRNPTTWRDAFLQIMKPRDLIDILEKCQKIG